MKRCCTSKLIPILVASALACMSGAAGALTLPFSGTGDIQVYITGDSFSGVPFTGSVTFDPGISASEVDYDGSGNPVLALYYAAAGGVDVEFHTPETSLGNLFEVGSGPVNLELFANGDGTNTLSIVTDYPIDAGVFALLSYTYAATDLSLPDQLTLTSGNASATAAVAGFFQASGTVTRFGAVPEPADWVLLLSGFGLTGGALRRRWRVVCPS